ncbi:MAG TPA: hypothetical protein PKM88_08185, partial [bacterium]|nr:hypothetical protein [bacterium]
MRKVMALCTGLLLLLTPVWGAEQARPRELSLELTTQSQAPMFVMPAGMNYPGMTDMNRPTRTLSGEAEYALPPSPLVQVAVPADLQLPLNLLALQLTRPETLVMPSGMGEVSGTTPTGRFQFTIRQYWHPDTYAGPLVENIDIDMNDMQRYRARGGYPGMTVVERAYDRTPSGSAEV